MVYSLSRKKTLIIFKYIFLSPLQQYSYKSAAKDK